MILRARLLVPLAMILLASACRHAPATSRPAAASVDPLAPSPRLIVGRVIAIDARQHFAFVELAPDAPANAVVDGTELIARALDLRETARLQSSRQVRGRTLGTRILGGQPSPGDEVVWLAP